MPPKGVLLRAKYEKVRDSPRLLRLLGLAEFDDDAPDLFV
jgi:hypothetical protein